MYSVVALVYEVHLLTQHVSHFPLDYIWRSHKVHVAQFHCAHWFFHLWVYSGRHVQTNFNFHKACHIRNDRIETLFFSFFFKFHLSLVDGVHDPGARVHAIISFLPHHPLLPIWAQRGPHRSTCGPHHFNTTDRPCAALHLLCSLLHPSAKSTDSHDEWHTLEGGPGARWALEDTGITHIWTKRMHWKTQK